MIQKKICLMGAHSVGKTSLISRFVKSIFGENYHTTVGVKIDKKVMSIDGTDMTFVIWDIAGEDEYTNFRPAYLRGVAAYIIVVDGTREATVDVAFSLHQKAKMLTGGVPAVFALNKSDLEDQWALTDKHRSLLESSDCPIIKTSAKTGLSVDDMFYQLGLQLLPVSVEG